MLPFQRNVVLKKLIQYGEGEALLELLNSISYFGAVFHRAFAITYLSMHETLNEVAVGLV